VEGNLRQRVEAGVGDVVQDRVVPLVPDAREDGNRRPADELCQFQVIEPGEVRHGAAATDLYPSDLYHFEVCLARSQPQVFFRHTFFGRMYGYTYVQTSTATAVKIEVALNWRPEPDQTRDKGAHGSADGQACGLPPLDRAFSRRPTALSLASTCSR
jgi:hypothetical protein